MDILDKNEAWKVFTFTSWPGELEEFALDQILETNNAWKMSTVTATNWEELVFDLSDPLDSVIACLERLRKWWEFSN